MKSVLGGLKINMTWVPEIWRDNLTTIQMTTNPVLHVRTKHVELDLYFVGDIVVQKQIQIKHSQQQNKLQMY